MESGDLSIGELADAAGLSRRAIRFYVQQQLLPPPGGRGRGRHYDGSHLERLRRIAELQAAGHSLDAIRRILAGGPKAGAARSAAISETGRRVTARPRPSFSAELWTRLRLGDGVELHFDSAKYQPDVQSLLKLRDAIRSVFRREPRREGNGEGNGDVDGAASADS